MPFVGICCVELNCRRVAEDSKRYSWVDGFKTFDVEDCFTLTLRAPPAPSPPSFSSAIVRESGVNLGCRSALIEPKPCVRARKLL